MSELFETSNRIYMEVFGHLDNELFKADKLKGINDWLEAGDPAHMTIAELIKAWVQHDSADVAWYGVDTVWGARATKPNKDSLYCVMMSGDRIRRFGLFMSGGDAPDGGARFAEFAKSQPLGTKWGCANFAGWMIETYPAEVESWLETGLTKLHKLHADILRMCEILAKGENLRGSVTSLDVIELNND